ncbi:capsular polysaccharide export protein, LipB/KpsS family [Rhodobacter maris]|uniref:Capsular polysaccharide export protein n=1 Tax=Rhodobacter maris TaxID=446682 RepID=A0A285T9X2_9RHOB|nr:capsular biosynthesis protein [Rhodobacter maris]SOC18340.1 capsular polysaccharide export protein [Rhodobacter maris]
MTVAPLRFTCLEERKGQRDLLKQLFPRIAEVTWLLAPPLGWRDYPQSEARAWEAYDRRKTPAATGVMRRLKQRLLKWQYNGARRYFEANKACVAVAWNAQAGNRYVFMQAARDAGVKRLFLELGPFPGTLTADPCGVNFVNGLPREIAPYLEWRRTTPSAEPGWRSLAQTIRQRAAAGEVKPSAADVPPLEAPYVFAPLQTPGDSQLRLFGGEHRSVEAFVRALVRASHALPAGWHLRLKEHPTAPGSLAEFITREARGSRVVLDNQTDTFAQVRAARAVVTVNSSVGLEAMGFDKPVIATGQCFWAFDGVAHHAPGDAELAQLFATADTLSFDATARDAFLGFLFEEYYPRLRRPDSPEIDLSAELAKLTLRLDPPAGHPIWARPCKDLSA